MVAPNEALVVAPLQGRHVVVRQRALGFKRVGVGGMVGLRVGAKPRSRP